MVTAFEEVQSMRVQEVQITAGQGHYILTRGKQRQGKI